MRRILLPVALLGLAAACDSPDATPPAAAPSPAAVVDCGTFDQKQGEGYPAEGGKCLIDADKAGKQARLQLTMPTTEGDPIIERYTTDGSGTVEIVSDARQDRFGPQQITRTTCTGIKPLKNWFDLTSCTEPVVLPSS